MASRHDVQIPGAAPISGPGTGGGWISRRGDDTMVMIKAYGRMDRAAAGGGPQWKSPQAPGWLDWALLLKRSGQP